jgi:hypothetical protein
MAIAESEVPNILRHAHDEVLLALWAETHEEEETHRDRADALMREAVRGISDDPRRAYDWAAVAPGH